MKFNYKKKIISHLPFYEQKSLIINETMNAIALELEKTEHITNDNYAELFIDTAIKALSIYENELGISKNTLTNVQRRELITAHFRAVMEQTTDETIKNVASAFSNGEVEIKKTDVEGVYEIKFVGIIGIPNNMQGLMNALDIIIPAHLEVIYTYIFNTWEDIGHKTWDTSSNTTWNELRTNEVI